MLIENPRTAAQPKSNTTSELLLKSYGRDFERLGKKMDKATDKAFKKSTKERWARIKTLSDDLYDLCGLMARIPAKSHETKQIKAKAAAFAFYVPEGDEDPREVKLMEAIVVSTLNDMID
jgi:hypothetical protein